MPNSLYKVIYVNGKGVHEHRQIMEKMLGRKLNKLEVVHHIDGNKRNNSINNLHLTSHSEHKKLHRKYDGCSISDCKRSHFSNSFCQKHHTKWYKTGNPNLPDRRIYKPTDRCSIQDCNKPFKRLYGGFCHAHYYRHNRYGSPTHKRDFKMFHNCSFIGCDRKQASLGYCCTHYRQKFIYHKKMSPIRKRRTLMEIKNQNQNTRTD